MLPRILEPELMDSPDEARDYDEMDHREVNRRFVDDLLAALGEGAAGDVLDLGTGTAQIPIELCRRGVECRVMAADAAINMLELARYNVEIAGLGQRIQLTHVDAKQMPFADEMFDVVMSNSIVHHLAAPERALAEMLRVLRPGGVLFVRDLMRPASSDSVEELVSLYAGDETERQRRMFRDSLHAALTVEEVRGMLARLGLPAGMVESTSDRHWTIAGMPAR